LRVPEDESDDRWTKDEPAPEEPAAAHDDIMKRLLDYQRSLREGASPEEAAEAIRGGLGERPEPTEAAVATEELVELDAGELESPSADESLLPPEPEPEPATPLPTEPIAPAEPEPQVAPPTATELEPVAGAAAGEPDLQGRLAALEAKLDLIGSKIVEVRRSFRELAVAADDRLATLEDELERVRRERAGG
jgi:hypothetical protein